MYSQEHVIWEPYVFSMKRLPMEVLIKHQKIPVEETAKTKVKVALDGKIIAKDNTRLTWKKTVQKPVVHVQRVQQDQPNPPVMFLKLLEN